MRGVYIVALLMIVLMLGCATTQPEAAPEAPSEEPAAPAETPPELPPVPEEPVSAEEPAEEEVESEMSDADMARIESLKASCERGAVNLCMVLKNQYGIDWPPTVTEEPEDVEGGEEEI